MRGRPIERALNTLWERQRHWPLVYSKLTPRCQPACPCHDHLRKRHGRVPFFILYYIYIYVYESFLVIYLSCPQPCASASRCNHTRPPAVSTLTWNSNRNRPENHKGSLNHGCGSGVHRLWLKDTRRKRKRGKFVRWGFINTHLITHAIKLKKIWGFTHEILRYFLYQINYSQKL